MDTEEIEFRPSLLSGNHKGFVAALTTDEYNKRRRLVTEAALTELGSSATGFSNYQASAHRHRLWDETCDAEGSRRGLAVLGKRCLAGVACVAVIVFGISAFQQHSPVLQEAKVQHLGHGLPIGHTLQPHCAIRDTIPELADTFSTFYEEMGNDGLDVQQPDANVSVSPEDSSSLLGTSKQSKQSHTPQIVTAPILEEIPCGGADEGMSVPASRGDNIHDADVHGAAVHAHGKMCISLNTQPVDMSATTGLLDTVCMPTMQLPLLMQRQPQQPDMPSTTEAPQDHNPLQRQAVPHEQDQPLSDEPPVEEQSPSRSQRSVHDTAPAGLSPRTLPSPSRPQVMPQSPAFTQPAPLIAPPVLKRTDDLITFHPLDQIEAILASRDLNELYAQLRSATAHPHGALVVWVAVLTPLLSIFAACFTASVALHVARVVLAALSNVCSASSHFTMRRLGSIARKLLPQTPSPPEEMILLELQAAMAQREADCRAKDEQLSSLRLLLDGVQLELQRCSDAEKDLTCKYNTALEELARLRKRHAARQSDRSRSDSSTRSSLIPGPALLEHSMARSATPSAFSDTESDGEAVGRLHGPPSPPAPAAASPAPLRRRNAAATLSSVPPPPRLGRVSAAAACSARVTQAQSFSAAAAGTPPPRDAHSPSSDHSESGFATCPAARVGSAAEELC